MSVPLEWRPAPRAALGVAVAAAVLASSGTAYGLWPTTGAGSSYAGARQLPVPSVTATCTQVDSITVAWTSETTPVVTSFVVARSTDGGTTWATIAGPVAAAGTTSYSVDDTALAEGTYTYRVTGLNNAWTGTGGLSPTRTVVAALTTGPKASRYPASCT